MSGELHNECGAVGTPRPTKTIDKPVGTAVPSRPDSPPSTAVLSLSNPISNQPTERNDTMNEIEKLRAEARDAIATFNCDMTDNDFELLAMRLASIGDRFERATEQTL